MEIAATKFDPALIAVLINREHSRLSSQVKTLERGLYAPFSDKEHQRLIQLAANWRAPWIQLKDTQCAGKAGKRLEVEFLYPAIG